MAGEFDIPPETPQLSLNALNGIHTDQTMKVTGKCHNSLYILIDSRSTHNFLDISTAKKLQCEFRRMPPLQVAVANGHQMQCNHRCRDFTWTLLGEVF